MALGPGPRLGRSRPAVGLAFRRDVVASFRELARLAGDGGPYAELRAFSATTIFHRGLTRLGFEPEPDTPAFSGWVAAYQRMLLASLHPGGALRLRSHTYRRARRLWLTREALLARYGSAREGGDCRATRPGAPQARRPEP